jgi:RNA polymerase sigma-70 factor (ECF subfamily)
MADPVKGFVERLFAEHRRALQAYFYRRVRKKSEVADLTQEVYLRMLRVGKSEAIRNPQVYLYAVASNLVKEHAILDRRESRHLDIDEASVQQHLGVLPSLDSAIDTSRQAERLRVAVEELPLNWRTAVVLQCRYGLTYQQIADHMGVSSSMVKKYLAQALTRCRRSMTR